MTVQPSASISHTGCYVVGGRLPSADDTSSDTEEHYSLENYYALVDGNRLPADLPVGGNAMVRGDSWEYSIAAASIVAKVTRDRLMHAYHNLYPAYNLQQHKGYPTAAHLTALQQYGPSVIHRRTFAPLKHMLKEEENGK